MPNHTPFLFRSPRATDLDIMYSILESSLSQFLVVNETSSKNNQLIIDKGTVEGYIIDSRYHTIVAEIQNRIVGWLSGSSGREILSEHGCNPGEFYLEEIVVDSAFRRKGVGSSLLSRIPSDNLEAVVVDTPLVNEQAILFYEQNGFVAVGDMPKEFSKNWVRMSKAVWSH
ncbi:MAG: GNAT family N-acetyltransferase [Thermoplasmataceae archaeon]